MYYSLTNGDKVRLELTNIALLRLRNDQPETYAAYYAALKQMGDEEKFDVIFDPLVLIYTAYLCGDGGDKMPFEDFVALCPYDIEFNAQIAGNLVSQKKATASAKPLKRQPKSEKTEA